MAKPVNIGVDGMLGQESIGGVVHCRTAFDGKSILLGWNKMHVTMLPTPFDLCCGAALV